MRVLVDANILLYAYDAGSPHHRLAREWLEQQISSGEPVKLALVTILAFIRIASDSRVFEIPLDVRETCRIVESWLSSANVQMLQPGPRSWQTLAAICVEGQARGTLVMDAHLAALAKEHGVVIATADKGFRRFQGVRTTNPLAQGAPV